MRSAWWPARAAPKLLDEAAVQRVGANGVYSEGVQRDLLPLIEATTLTTKYGAVRADHILFIASGAFQGGAEAGQRCVLSAGDEAGVRALAR